MSFTELRPLLPLSAELPNFWLLAAHIFMVTYFNEADEEARVYVPSTRTVFAPDDLPSYHPAATRYRGQAYEGLYRNFVRCDGEPLPTPRSDVFFGIVASTSVRDAFAVGVARTFGEAMRWQLSGEAPLQPKWCQLLRQVENVDLVYDTRD